MWGREGQEASHRPELLSHRWQDGLRTHPSRDCKGWEGTRLGRERSVQAGGRWRGEMLADHLSQRTIYCCQYTSTSPEGRYYEETEVQRS